MWYWGCGQLKKPMYKSHEITELEVDAGMVFFTADTHFGHDNARIFDGSPFGSVEERDSVVVSNFINDMPPGSTLCHLGDLAWSEDSARRFLRAMSDGGIRVMWICGNHDRRTGMSAPLPQNMWLKLPEKTLFPGIWLSHYPHLAWPRSFHGSIHLFGHVHGECGKLPPFGRLMDVGVMNWDYRPVPLPKVLELMDGREAAPV